ncbi:MAG: hypothetical protein KJ043_23380, partial [Anaerolineae bacterium]|nr:hypothetical protein [Anaerolineae bacterium]
MGISHFLNTLPIPSHFQSGKQSSPAAKLKRLNQQDGEKCSMNDRVVTIGVAGGTASGKSTISRAILDRVGTNMIAHLLHDSYYKELSAFGPDTLPEDINFDHPNSLDTPLLVEHLRQLQQW